jgi:phage regulator Rha-like protein
MLTTIATTLSNMSTREIAELTGKEHRNVMRDARNMLEQLGKDVLSFGATYHDAYGRPQPVFNLPKDLTLTLVAGYSISLRAKIITRWMELEKAKPAFALPQTFAQALTLAAQQAEQLEEAHAAQDPLFLKVVAFDRGVAIRG